MSPAVGVDEGKTALDLALELGVRSETVVHTLQKLGLEGDGGDAAIDPEMEEMLVDQMVTDGLVPPSLSKGKNRRKRSSEPFVDDDLLTEALGASETGFSESHIPRQLLVESRFSEQPSLWQRLFKKKKDLVRTLKENLPSEDDLKSFFSSSSSSKKKKEESSFSPSKERSPFSEEETETEDEREKSVTQPFVDEKDQFEEPTEDEPTEEELSEENEEKEDVGEAGLEDLDLDESLLEELEGVDLDEEELGELDESELQELEDLTDEETEEIEEVEEESEESTGELDEELESLEEEAEGDDGEEGDEEDEQEEETEPNFIERILSRIQLSPVEMWTIMSLSIVTMLIVLVGTIYWWRNKSPEAISSLLEQANAYYDSAKTLQQEDANFQKEMNTWQNAAETYEQFINEYPDNPNTLLAFQNLCDSYYQMATGYDEAGQREKSEEPYRKMAQYYESFLNFLDDLATKMVGVDPQYRYLSYPSPEDQRTAMLRIAQAQSRLGRFDIAIEKLKDFVKRFGSNREDVVRSMVEIGDTYQKWANVKTDQKTALLNEAIKAYNQALDIVPEDEVGFRVKTNVGLGDIEYSLYQKNRDEGEEAEATPHLLEAIAYYERAQEVIKNADSLPVSIEEKHEVLKQLGDLYLIRGREAGTKWRNFEENAEPYPQVYEYKKDLLEAADRSKQDTTEYLEKATELYNKILDDKNTVNKDMLYDIQYKKAESNFILKKYPEAIAAGEELVSASKNLTDTMMAKVYYLLGNAAWEQAKQTEDYSQVKEFYREALRLDPFYPKDQGGEISHLAEIRLNNAYFILDKKYEDALLRFDNMVKRFPDDDYTYLTRYYYAKALEEYGDQLFDQAQKKVEELKNMTGSEDSNEAKELREEAKQHYSDAVNQYELALRSRDISKYVDTKNERFKIEMIFRRGESAYKADKYLEAKQYLEEALDEYRTNEVAQQYLPDAIERLGDVNVRLYDFDNAIRHYQDYLKNGYVDENAQVSMKLADAYFKGLDHEKAREWYRKIMADHPPITEKEVERKRRLGLPIQPGPGFEALKKLANSYYRQAADFSGNERRQMLEQALTYYEELANRYPKISAGNLSSQPTDNVKVTADTEAQRMVGNIHYELGNYAQAAANYEAYLQNVPNYNRRGRIYYRIGKSYHENGEYDKAFDALKNVTLDTLDNPIQYADALILLGQAYEAKAEEQLAQDKPQLYESNLERAKQAYDRVSITNVKNKITQAQQAIGAIERILQARRELAKAGI